MRDLLIAGGGPVGLAAALHAAGAGLDVTVLEPRRGPLDKACGEGLMPGAVAALRDLGVPVTGVPLAGIRYLDGAGHVAQAGFRSGPGLGVRRTELHAALAAAVAAAGVAVIPHRVTRVRDAGDHVVVDDLVAQHLIAADGLHSPVRRALDLDRPARSPRRFGQRCHVAMAPWTSFVEVHWASIGEAYVTPVAPDQVGVAVLTSERRPLRELLPAFAPLADRLGDRPLSPVLGAGPLRQRAHRRGRGRVLLVGDAAGYVDALTGEGIATGFAQARAAVAAVAAGDPAGYEHLARRLGWRHAALTRALLAGTRPQAARTRLVPAAARLSRVFEAAVDQLARPA